MLSADGDDFSAGPTLGLQWLSRGALDLNGPLKPWGERRVFIRVFSELEELDLVLYLQVVE
ncbi:hypothetical protein D514_0118370 [Microbacterium sp. UCD-TDU]|nr:hypothetical protein D514_0118370 [Microbacterium sp. UCD-TDU]